MTTFVTFTPSLIGSPPSQFSANLDGNQFTVSVFWNFGAQRWYIEITDQFSNTVVYRPLVGSPAPNVLTSLEWANGIVTAIAANRLGFRIGTLLNTTITAVTDNGVTTTDVFQSTVTGPTTFTYPMPVNTWQNGYCNQAFWSLDQNLAGGFFKTSTLVFRASTQTFEVNP